MKRLRLLVTGSVQGVGFRPFIYRLACRHQLCGSVANTSVGVDIDVQGDDTALADFQKNIAIEKPERAVIGSITVCEAPLSDAREFVIKNSVSASETALALLPDTAICPECLAEFSDPASRRHNYPFIHCMTCGPRFSLFLRMPFDRMNTTMADFPMCEECRQEYDDPGNRRFYSQTTCCPACGPKLTLFDANEKKIAADSTAIAGAIEALLAGKIVAMKNTGGYLLLADATNEKAVQQLRLRKRRAKKPFALLMGDLAQARRSAVISLAAEQVLTSPPAPIVLLPKAPRSEISPAVSYDTPYLGIMLAHHALQRIITQGVGRPLIATSGNISDRPICITEEKAFSELSSVADVFLTHNRRIIHRLDDSIVQMISGRPMMIRRARGYIPHAFFSKKPLECTLAAGGEMKNSFAIGNKTQIYISQHLGDLDSVESCQAYEREVESFESLLQVKPSIGIKDLHPDYYPSRYIEKRPIRQMSVQHHKAHLLSCMLDCQITAPVLGIVWDGTGFGEDGTIWGGEAFMMGKTIERFASLLPFRLPGADKAVREPRRSALGLLDAMFGESIPQQWLEHAFQSEERAILQRALRNKVNSPLCTSMGRLFDSVSALLGICLVNDFEGQAAMALEAQALRAKKCPRYTIPLIGKNLDWRGMIQQIMSDKMAGVPIEEIALGFHQALANSIVMLAQASKMKNVCLTGGVMQNRLLLENAIEALKSEGFTPFWHEHLPPNDGGLAAGQLCV